MWCRTSMNNYVEEVNIQQAMRGAMRGLSDALDPDSAYLTPELVKAVEQNASPGAADIGVELTRQVLPARRVGA